MTRPSNDIQHLESELRHFGILLDVIAQETFDITFSGMSTENADCLQKAQSLLWIARGIVEQMVENAEACTRQSLNAKRMVGGDRNG